MLEQLLTLDRSLFFFINVGCSSPVLDALMPMLREKLTWMPFYVMAALFIIHRHRKNSWYILGTAGVCILLSDQLSSTLIKPIFARLRPCNDLNVSSQAHLLLQTCGVGYSFVSSHAANHFAIAVFAGRLFGGPWLQLLLLGWATVVSIAQVYVGVHYPLDIVCGGVLGVACGWGCYQLLQKSFPHSLQKG